MQIKIVGARKECRPPGGALFDKNVPILYKELSGLWQLGPRWGLWWQIWNVIRALILFYKEVKVRNWRYYYRIVVILGLLLLLGLMGQRLESLSSLVESTALKLPNFFEVMTMAWMAACGYSLVKLLVGKRAKPEDEEF